MYLLDDSKERSFETAEADLPELGAEDIEMIEENEELPELSPADLEMIPLVNPDVNFDVVDVHNDAELLLLAAKMFERVMQHPNLRQDITKGEMQTGSVTLAQGSDPMEHPLFRLIADRKIVAQMRELAEALRGETASGKMFMGEARKGVTSRGNAEMRAVKLLFDRVQGALDDYKKIKTSEVKKSLDRLVGSDKIYDPKILLNDMIEHVMNTYLTREEVGWHEAQEKSVHRLEMRSGSPSGLHVKGIPRKLASARFADKWSSEPERMEFVRRMLDGVAVERVSSQNADLALQAEAIRELKQAYNQKIEAARAA